ncbi:uncharacterized protein RJT21DRAFT_122396 [Scheffersomyces amazonensis]|uniref:uncharacterized protein n=1 Tax=Scheffersomyces amazonensis TaxID=1078765 RepID=UPI00315DE38C
MKDGEYKVSMDIWVAITIMLSNNKIPFCNWEHLTKWLRIPKICFNSRNITAQIISLNSWKAVVYNLSYRDLEYVKGVIEPILRNSTTIDERNQAITNVLKSKTRLTTHLFNSINACDAPEDVINALHNLFLSILYSFINPMTNNNNQGTKYLYIYWDKIIQPIILNFYFKKDASTPYMHDLGLMVLNRLMRFSNNQSNERKFNEVRCLANDPVTLAEVNPLPNRWIYARFDKVVHSLALVFQSNHLTIEKKFNFLQSFLNYIKPITKKEIRPTKSTITMMENISVMFYQLLNPDLSFELINKTLTAFLDTFEPSLLFSKESRNITRDTYLKVIEISLNKFTDNQITCLLKLMFPVTSDGADLIMILDLSIIQDKEKNKALEEFLEEFFNSRIVSSKLSEVESCGEICTVLPIGFETFIKKVVQAVVTITNTEDLSKGLEYLKVNSWKSENYKFFLRLMKNAPNPLIQEFVVDSIKFKISDNNSFVDLFKFLVEDKFYSQLSCIHQEIITSGSKLEGFLLFNFRDIFSQYLTDVSLNPTLIEDLDNLLVDNHKNLQINIDIFIKKNIGILPKVRKSLGLELGLSNAEEMSAEMSAEISETSNDSKPEETQVDETQVDTTPAVNIEESTENEVSEIPSEKVLELVNLDEIDVSSSSEAVVSGESIESHDSNSHENPVTNGSFDIHSFTAMLNSKLQTASPSKAKGRKRKQKKSSDESQSPKVSKRGKSKVEVSSSVESIDEISESENDSLSQTTMGNDSEMVDDESISNNSEIETHNTDKQTQIEIPLEQSDNSEIIDDFVKHEDDMIIESQSGETDSGSSSNSQLVTFESQNFKGHSTSNEGNVTDISKESISESISSSSLSSSDGSLVLVTKEMVLSTIVEHEPADMQEPPEVPDIVPETTEVIPEVTEAIEETTKTISETTEAIPETNEAIPNTIEAIPETNDTQVNETQSNSLLKSLETVLNISDEDIRNLDAQDKYDLETKLLQLMLRVRNVGMRN